MKVPAFHTNSDEYRDEERRVYHDQSDCHYGKQIKKDGNDVPGVGVGRERCDRCEELG